MKRRVTFDCLSTQWVCENGEQEFRRTDFGGRLLEDDGEGGGGSEGERTGVGEGEGCV
jgi:hypothetical protein